MIYCFKHHLAQAAARVGVSFGSCAILDTFAPGEWKKGKEI